MKRCLLPKIALLISALWLIQGAAAARTNDSFALVEETATLDLGETQVTDWEAFFAFLDARPELEKVDMFATVVKRAQIETLSERYPQIEFGWTMEIGDHLVRTDATVFSTLHYSGSPSHATREMSLLRFCKNLRALDIGHNAVDDLSFLYELPELRVLIVACNRIENIEPVASLKHLEYLEMFSNFVEDISPLKELPYLAHLNVGYNNISDLSPLYEMKNLKRLWLKKCHSRQEAPPLESETLDALQKALPDCIIDAKHNPSEGGWRDCVEYETFHAYFYNGEYRPFPSSPKENQ